MKKSLIMLFSLLLLACGKTEVKDLHPTLGEQIDLSDEGAQDFALRQQSGEEFPGGKENYWDVHGVGCSFYCGAFRVVPTVSSARAGQDGVTFGAENLHDDSYRTAWVVGDEEKDRSASATYVFPPTQPRITQVIVANGFLKSDGDWRDHSRAKSLMMYVDDKAVALLHLEDTKQLQVFDVDTIGYAERADKAALSAKPEIRINFEVLDSYPGEKHDAVAITEIFFDGIDVH